MSHSLRFDTDRAQLKAPTVFVLRPMMQELVGRGGDELALFRRWGRGAGGEDLRTERESRIVHMHRGAS